MISANPPIPRDPMEQSVDRSYFLAISIAFALLLANSTFIHVRSALLHPERTDVSAYYAAANTLATGDSSIYDRDNIADVARMRRVPGGARPYLYPPFLAQLLSPLAHPTFSSFRIGWILITHFFLFILFLTTISLVVLELHVSRGLVAATAFIVFSSFSPIEREVFYGQATILSASLLYLALLLERRSFPMPSAFLAAVGILTKVYPIVVLPLYLLKRQYRLLSKSLLWITAIIGSSIAIFGFQDWHDFVLLQLQFEKHIYPSHLEHADILESPNYSLTHFLYLASRAVPLSIDITTLGYVSKVLFFLFLACYGRAVYRYLRRDQESIVLVQVLLGILMLATPALWNHVFILIAPGFVYGTSLMIGDTRLRNHFYLLGLSFLLIAVADFTPNLGILNHGGLLLLKPLKLYGLLLFLAVYAFLIRERSERPMNTANRSTVAVAFKLPTRAREK